MVVTDFEEEYSTESSESVFSSAAMRRLYASSGTLYSSRSEGASIFTSAPGFTSLNVSSDDNFVETISPEDFVTSSKRVYDSLNSPTYPSFITTETLISEASYVACPDTPA